MSEVTENKETNNYDETKCPSCNEQYNEEQRIPRILLNCGHTICSQCISTCENSTIPLKCPEDGTECQNISLSSFPINKALLKLLHKISESKKDLSENSLLKSLSIKSPKSSQNKGMSTARASRINLENLKLTNSKLTEKCSEHPSRNIEMICLEELCKICTNCAIFGKHKNHNVINIDEFVKDIEIKADKLIELLENISDGEIKKEIEIINDKSKINLNNLLNVINDKYNSMTNVIHEFTLNLIEKVKKDENILIGEISNQFDKLRGRVKYYLELNDKINLNVNEWKNKVEDNMTLLNQVKDLSNECLKFVDCYGDNLYNKLIKSGNNIIYDIHKIITFPIDEIQEEIKNLNLTIEKQILSQEFFHLSKKIDFGDLFNKYEKEKNSTKKKENIFDNEYQKITLFTENDRNITKNKEKEKTNSLTDDSDNGVLPDGKSANDLFIQKEMDIENIEFGDDSFLFTDLDLMGLNFESRKKNNNTNANIKKMQKPKNIGILDLNNNDNNIKVNKCKIGHVKNIKSTDLISFRNNISYDRDSFDISLKNTPANKKRTIKKTKSNINLKKSPSISKKRVKNKLGSNKTYNSNNLKTTRSLSPFNSNKKAFFKSKFKKTDKINLSRNELNEEDILSLIQQIKFNKDKLKEIKLIKCGINNENVAGLLKAMENCVKLNFINLANNFLDDKSMNNIINFLKKSNSIVSFYLSNNNFTTGAKENIKSYNRKGKIKIFI